MSIEKNVEVVKNFLAALGRRDKQGLLALSAEDIEWIIPGEDWPLAGTHRGHAGLADLLQKANETVETAPSPPEFIAQGDRVLVVGFATPGRIIATNKTLPLEDHWVFAITVQNGKLANVREYVDIASTGAGLRDVRWAPGPDPSTPMPYETIRNYVYEYVETAATPSGTVNRECAARVQAYRKWGPHPAGAPRSSFGGRRSPTEINA